MNSKLLIILTCTLITSCFSSKKTDFKSKATQITKENSELKTDKRGLSLVKATIKTVHGNIVFRFYPEKAPNTTRRISNLIKKSFYDGLIFHRVIPNFVIQTGDPMGNGQGGSGTLLKAEFNDLSHIRGTVSMARKQSNIDSADSQFFIALKSLPHLDGKYTIIGQVTEGLPLVDKIQRGDKIISLTLSNSDLE